MAVKKGVKVTNEDVNNNNVMLYHPNPLKRILGQQYVERPRLGLPTTVNEESPKIIWNPFAYLCAIGVAGALGSIGRTAYFGLTNNHAMMVNAINMKKASLNIALVSMAFSIYYYKTQRDAIQKGWERI